MASGPGNTIKRLSDNLTLKLATNYLALSQTIKRLFSDILKLSIMEDNMKIISDIDVYNDKWFLRQTLIWREICLLSI